VGYLSFRFRPLLAIDSSIGSGVAINHHWAKNMIGASTSRNVSLRSCCERSARGWMLVLAESSIRSYCGHVLFFGGWKTISALMAKSQRRLFRAIRRSCDQKRTSLDWTKGRSLRAVLNFGHIRSCDPSPGWDMALGYERRWVANWLLNRQLSQQLRLVDRLSSARLRTLIERRWFTCGGELC
jgi:hypothetical protein